MKKQWLFSIILVFIIGLSFFLRGYKIDQVPPSLNWDEVSNGYNAYSILKTGKDEWGFKFPLIFRAYGDYKLPLYIYTSVASIAIFGLNAISIRFVSILSGVGLVFVSYLITREVVKDKWIAVLAAFFTAISPWSLFLSRGAFEANLGCFLFALGTYFFIRWFKESKIIVVILSFIFWGLSLYCYNSARVLVPLTAILFLFLMLRKKLYKHFFWGIAIFALFLLPVIWQFIDQTGSARFQNVSLIDQGVVNQIIEARQNSQLPIILTRLVHNRPVYFFISALTNYFLNLSPSYLFVKGGSHYQFSIPGYELLYLVTAPLLILGLYTALRGSLEKKIVALWFFAGFIPSAITRDAPHVLRSILVLPSPMILSSFGLLLIYQKLKGLWKISATVGILFLLLISFGRWWNQYFYKYPQEYSFAWQYGYKEAALFVKDHYQDYQKIFVTKKYGEPHEFFLFNFGWDPINYQNNPSKKWDYHANWYWINGFDKLIFVNDWEVKTNVKCQMSNVKCLLVTSPGNYPEGWSKIKTINFLDQKPAFDILEK